MLTAVPDPPSHSSWVQVLGRVSVHHGIADFKRLSGSGQRLLAVLVAAGIEGATAERIAEEIWGATQPDPWRPALRMAVARLRKQLPDGWDVVADGGAYRIDTADGWIDAWRLEQIASDRSLVGEEDLEWMLAGSPFGDHDPLEMVSASAQNLQMLQIAVAERFCAQAPSAISMASCTALSTLLREHPYNDRLAVLVATALAGAERRTEALLALSAFADAYSSEFGAVPIEVANFLAARGQLEPVDRIEPITPASPGVVALPKELRHLTDSPMVGRADELAQLTSSRGALVTGATGSGKSRLLAEFIATDSKTATTYVVGDDRMDIPLGPFAVAMPILRDELLATVHSEDRTERAEGSAEKTVATRAWRIVLAHLEAQSASRPQRLVVDDAHLLDQTSLGMLRLLIRSNTTADLMFVVCGRSDHDDVEWSDLKRDAERAGLEPIHLGGLALSELEFMVYQQFPVATRQARRGLAREVSEASDGLPAVAVPLIEAADPLTLARPENVAGASTLARVTASLSDQAPEVVAAAAVLGQQFSVGTLIALTELDEVAVFRVLDELWSTGLIVETDDPDQVKFRHVLIQQSFLEGVPLFRRGQLHRRAADLSEDPHRIADHQANAAALVPAETAAASLRISAQIYANRRQWRNVAREMRRVDDLGGNHLDGQGLTLWAAALDQSGADGSPQRRLAYERASAIKDWDAALDAAISGLPEAEKPDGDVERISMLEGIPAEQLTQARQFDRAYTLGRQYSLLPELDEVMRYSGEALAVASNPDEVGLCHVLQWMATRHVTPNAHSIPEDVVLQASPSLQTRIAQINAINLAERGDFESARVEAGHFQRLAGEIGDPLRIWHAQGLRTMFVINDGDFEAAEELALRNMQFAELHDMQQGPARYIGFRVFSYDCQDRLSELKPDLEPYRANLSRIHLGRAALVLCDEAAGEPDVADEVRSVVQYGLDRAARSTTLLAILMVVKLIPRHAPELAGEVRKMLEHFGDNPILAGFGAGSFGPTTRYVAHLTTSLEARRALFDESVVAADRHGPLLWRVLCRLDAADLGSQTALDEATSIAAGSGLAAVVARRAERIRRES